MAGLDAPKRALSLLSNSESITCSQQKEQSYYLIQSRTQWMQTVYDGDGNAYQIQPLVAVRTGFEGWRTAPMIHERMKSIYAITGDIIYGRQFGKARAGGEVELFAMPDGKEAAGLRKEMERAGLAVRSWVPTSSKTKTLSCVLTCRPEKTFREKCYDVFQKRVDEWEAESDEIVQYALIADSGGQGSNKHLLGVIVGEKDFNGLVKAAVAGRNTTITTGDYVYNIVGFYGDRQLTFVRGDDELKVFFGKRVTNVAVAWFNLKKDREKAAVEQYKRQKKAAKKQRRQQPACAPTIASGNLEDKNDNAAAAAEEVRKQKKRERAKAKKKAYTVRHKAYREEGENNRIGKVTAFLIGPTGPHVRINAGNNANIVISWLGAASHGRKESNTMSLFWPSLEDGDFASLDRKYTLNEENRDGEESAERLGITLMSGGGNGGSNTSSNSEDEKDGKDENDSAETMYDDLKGILVNTR